MGVRAGTGGDLPALTAVGQAMQHRIRFLLGILLIVGVVVAVALWPVQVGHRLRADFIPPDQSFVGPNIVASAVLVLGGYFILSPIKARLDRNARLSRHIIEHTEGIPTTNRQGHSLLTDEFLDDPDPATLPPDTPIEGMVAPDFAPGPPENS